MWWNIQKSGARRYRNNNNSMIVRFPSMDLFLSKISADSEVRRRHSKQNKEIITLVSRPALHRRLTSQGQHQPESPDDGNAGRD